MDMSDLIWIAIVAYLCWQVFQIFAFISMRAAVNERMHIMNHLNNIIHEVRVEQHGPVEYWYDNHDHNFLAQGKDQKETIDNLSKRFPEHIFILPDVGAVAKQTDWKVVTFDEFKKKRFEATL